MAAVDRTHLIAEFGMDGTILYADKKFLDLFGYSASELIGRHHRVLATPADAQSADYADFWRRLKAGEFTAGRFRRIDKNSCEIWLDATYNPLLDARGRAYKVMAYATEATESVRSAAVQAAAKLASANAPSRGRVEPDIAAGERRPDFLGRVLEESGLCALVVDRGGAILYANPAFERSSGLRGEDVIGVMVVDLVFGRRTEARVVANIRRCLAGGEAFADDVLVYDQDRRSSWASLAINPVRSADGRTDVSVWMQRDATDAKQRAFDLAGKLDAIGDSNAIAEWSVDGAPITGNRLIAGGEPFDIPLGRLLDDDAIAEVLRAGRLRRDVAVARSQNEPLWLDAVFSRLADQEGRPWRILMCGAEIHARRAAATRSIEGMSLMVERIASLVEVITTLARQTNLLALNAAVEAARAKASGRGFAVVAHELRKLSIEAAAATSRITSALADGRALIRSMSERDAVDNDSMTQRRAIAFSRALRERRRG